MKSQLLEDIGQSATLSLVPSGKISNISSLQGEPDIAQAGAATPARPRPVVGVWRQRPAGEPVVIATQQPDKPAPPEVSPPLPPQQVHEPAIPPAEPTRAANATQSKPVPQGTVFHFAPPWPAMPAPKLVRREPTWFERSGRRYLLWGSCVLSGALLIQAGLWLYEKQKDADAPPLVANELKTEPQADKTLKRRTTGANEFTLDSGALASLPNSLSRTAPTVPPLVLLEPDPATATKVEPPPLLEAGRAGLHAPPKPELVATEQAPAVPLPKRVRPTARAQPDAAAEPARAPVTQAERKSEQDSAIAATLKACREHGYHAEQCVKRACSVTKYGFVCRGK